MDDIGYEISRFPNIPYHESSQFACNICTLIVREPKECSSCGSLYCSICIDQWLMSSKECPKKNCDLSKSLPKKICGALLMLYNNISIKCKYSSCSVIRKMCEIEKHEISCQSLKCVNFEVCGNLVKQEFKDLMVCDLSCLLLSKIKPNYGNWMAMHAEIKSFIKKHVNNNIQPPKKSLSFNTPNIDQYDSNLNLTNFKWDQSIIGSNIKLSENFTKIFLKDSAYMFRSVIGDQGFMQGIHYWELIADPQTENELKIGVVTKKDFPINSSFSDYECGFAYYGIGQLRQNSNSIGENYGKKFKQNGILGVCLNMYQGTLSFALDGESMGVAYKNDTLKKGPIYAAVALLHCAGIKLITQKPVPNYFKG